MQIICIDNGYLKLQMFTNYSTPREFFTSVLTGGLSLDLSDSKSPPVSSQYSGRSQRWMIFLWFSFLPVPFSSLWEPFQVHQLQLVSPSPLCSTIFESFGDVQVFAIFCLSFIFTQRSAGTAKLTRRQVLPFFSYRFGHLTGLDYPFISRNSGEFYMSHFLGWILVCAKTIW